MNHTKTTLFITFVLIASVVLAKEDPTANQFELAARNAGQAQAALAASLRYVTGWLRHADPRHGHFR